MLIVQILIRRHLLQHLIWVCSVFLSHIFGTLGIKGLTSCGTRSLLTQNWQSISKFPQLSAILTKRNNFSCFLFAYTQQAEPFPLLLLPFVLPWFKKVLICYKAAANILGITLLSEQTKHPTNTQIISRWDLKTHLKDCKSGTSSLQPLSWWYSSHHPLNYHRYFQYFGELHYSFIESSCKEVCICMISCQ